jgi:PAS domain S-box-containing protein
VLAAANFANVLLVHALRRRITARQPSQAAQSEAARFRSLFEADMIGISITDAKGVISEANDAFLTMIGYTRQEVTAGGYPSRPAVTASDSRALDSARIEEVIRGARCSPWRKEYLRKDGERVPAIAVAARSVSEPQRAICLSLDLTSVSRAEQNLRTLSGRLLRLHDDERRRIARELHDATAQNLAAISMNLTMLQPTDANSRSSAIIAECTSVTEECLRQVRSLSYYLHPPLLDELGLGSALRAYLDAYTRRTGIAVGLHLANDFRRLGMDLESALFRIAQECLENVHQHSGSDRAEVYIAASSEGIELTVRDFGKGFDERQTCEGVGLAAIRERARQFSGRIEIRPADPGVEVRAIIPGE